MKGRITQCEPPRLLSHRQTPFISFALPTYLRRCKMIDWQWCEHGLAAPQWYAVIAAREAAFVVEQACAYQELDGWDLCATHD
jgi:hypothetical protein